MADDTVEEEEEEEEDDDEEEASARASAIETRVVTEVKPSAEVMEETPSLGGRVEESPLAWGTSRCWAMQTRWARPSPSGSRAEPSARHTSSSPSHTDLNRSPHRAHSSRSSSRISS